MVYLFWLIVLSVVAYFVMKKVPQEAELRWLVIVGFLIVGVWLLFGVFTTFFPSFPAFPVK